MEIKKVLKYKHYWYYWKDGDIATHQGKVTEKNIQQATTEVTSESDKILRIAPASWNDQLKKIKRGPQIIMPKDIAYIMSAIAITKDSIVVEAGTGCGIAAIHMARLAKEVISYEINEEHIQIANKNIQKFETTNITIKHKDITQGIDENNVDAILLDIPEPEKVIEQTWNAIKQGGYLAIYLPTISQIQTFLKENNKFHIEEVTELIKRDWSIHPERLRPASEQVNHTAFIMIARKI